MKILQNKGLIGQVAVKFAFKPSNINDVLTAAAETGNEPCGMEVMTEVEFEAHEYEALAQDFSAPRQWLSDWSRLNSNPLGVLKISCTGKTNLYVSPNRRAYAHMVGVEA